MSESAAIRPLTEREHRLAKWMLEHGSPEAAQYLTQLARADATAWRCVCGCASFNFKVPGVPAAPPGVNILGDFLAGKEQGEYGVFIFQSGGILSGVEVYGLAADAPQTLPQPEELRAFVAAGEAPTPQVPSVGRNDGQPFIQG
ncbi:MAG: hypothetical protein AB3X44_06035 [Leptothrix sp. (in: b-proteobacteria)]